MSQHDTLLLCFLQFFQEHNMDQNKLIAASEFQDPFITFYHYSSLSFSHAKCTQNGCRYIRVRRDGKRL